MGTANHTDKELRIGQVIAGKYRLEQELGRGAMGVVYRAMQEPMNREVALKTLLPQAIIHPSMIARFKREVKVVSQLKHPHTITIFDYGSLDSGLLFFAMELLDGISLADVIKAEGTLEPERARQITIQILKSLAEAHSKGIIHRDLKPQNIFICNVHGERDYVKVLDFGIAKALDDPESKTSVEMTDTGMTLGTPVYMAPEQIDRKLVSPSTDLYALGALLYEMLGGRQLFHGTSWLKIAMKKLGKAPVDLRNDILYGPLGGVIVKAVQKDTMDRYQQCAEMLAHLEAVGNLGHYPRLPRVHAAVTATAELDRYLLDMGQGLPRVLPLDQDGNLSPNEATRVEGYGLGVDAHTTVSPRLERPVVSDETPTLDLYAALLAQPTRVIVADPTLREHVPEPPRDSQATRVLAQMPSPGATDPLPRPKLDPQATQVFQPSDATQVFSDLSAVRGAQPLGAAQPQGEQRNAIAVLLLIGVVLLAVSAIVILALAWAVF